MKPRIEKKLSKKLSEILGGLEGFKEIWIDKELELLRIHYKWHGKGANGELTPRQKRQNYQQNVRVNCMPSIGGYADYWGETTDIHSVFYVAKEFLTWGGFYIKEYEPENDFD